MMNPRMIALVFYVFLMIMLFSQLPINEYTLGTVVIILTLLVLGLVFILGSHYIIPYIKRSWRMGSCQVKNKKYLICETGTSSEKVGYAFIKVVPEQPVADMDKERRESFLQTVQGILSGTQFEAMLAYITVKDRYGENIKKRLEREKEKLTMFAHRETLRTRDLLERIRKELELLRQVPVLLEGFYIAVVRDYDYDDYSLVQKLEADSRALMSRLSGIGVTAQEMKGEELWVILKFMQFGSVTQITWT
jgi:hypothetical protein